MSPQEQDTSFIAEALPAFISEAHEHLAALEQLLLELEGDSGNRQLLDALFRSAHTIKGSAGLFGLVEVAAFTHHVETLLDQLRDGTAALTPETSTLLLRCNDEIRVLICAAERQAPADAASASRREALVQGLRAISAPSMQQAQAATAPSSESAPDAGLQSWRIRVDFGIETFRDGMDPLALLSYLRGLGDLNELQCSSARLPEFQTMDPEACYLTLSFVFNSAVEHSTLEAAFDFIRAESQVLIEALPDASLQGAALDRAHSLDSRASLSSSPAATSTPTSVRTDETPPPSPSSAPAASDEPRFIRVPADRLDLVINLLGELVIASAGASLLAKQSRQGALMAANEQIGQLVEEVRNGTLQLRMVQIGETFSRFRRVVRDTAAELNKDVALQIMGGDTELDKSVVERIADPMMHLVRNALDHGLESPEERIAAGKSPQGRLTLSARHEAGSILIQIEDDGRGVRRQKVLQRAWERGLVEAGVQPSDADILRLIFAPGFSTAEKVTNLSGRGVGMDVVRSNIEQLRGNVAIDSVEGQGTRITIRLPLTLAIIDGFLVGVGQSKFIFPLDAVVEVIENRPALAAMDERGRGTVELRSQVLPVVGLRELYAIDSATPERSSVVVLQSSGQRYGVQVDQLLGQHQTVIKPLGRMFRSLRGMSGSSILGNGEVALIFDVHSLCQLATDPPHRHANRHTAPLREGHTS
ncbi:chemotaxis protein CheA [Paucibacter sp. DJ1R-11]|uniref:chemotaxis protein CheA n=1 Tax=Paucibacter sp. DJ1R-11 TaxID=2893556 RepID=UPI0021E4061F|nr:chemotaxis protein CheA [Paucibacter sp. DJ1R-11]MCV2364662.1 chemotaxis protein CheA [Paucibacter sp. DJ1R-11]